MAIKLPDGRIMRTLPEQVDKNMQDIASINNEVNVIKESITTAYKIQGSATVADLNANTPDAAMNGYVYNMTDAGSLINSDETTTSVQIGDNVVLVWNDGSYFWDCLSGVVDTSNLVTLDSEQEITGKKIFLTNITAFKYQVGNSQYTSISSYGNTTALYLQSNTGDIKIAGTINPTANANYNLGSLNYTWKDLYLSDYIEFKSPNAGRYWRITVDAAQNLIIQSSTNRNSWSNECFWNSNGDLNLLSNDLIIAGNIKDSSSNSVKVAEIIKKRLTVQYTVSAAASTGISMINLTLSADDLAKLDPVKPLIIANNSTSSAVISAVYLPGLNLFSVLAYQTQGNTSLNFDIYQ